MVATRVFGVLASQFYEGWISEFSFRTPLDLVANAREMMKNAKKETLRDTGMELVSLVSLVDGKSYLIRDYASENVAFHLESDLKRAVSPVAQHLPFSEALCKTLHRIGYRLPL